MRTIGQIDQDIDAVRRGLMARLHCHPECSAQAWQNAWDRCPDLRSQENALFLERGIAQKERDLAAEKQHRKQQRAQRANDRKAANSRCPTCGFQTLAAA